MLPSLDRNPQTMQTCLKIFDSVLPRLNLDQVRNWLPLLSATQVNSDPVIRRLTYSVLMSVYKTTAAGSGAATADSGGNSAAADALSYCTENLLLALSDDSPANRYTTSPSSTSSCKHINAIILHILSCELRLIILSLRL